MFVVFFININYEFLDFSTLSYGKQENFLMLSDDIRAELIGEYVYVERPNLCVLIHYQFTCITFDY